MQSRARACSCMRVFALISQNLISAALFPPLAWPPLGRSTDPHSRMAPRVEFDRAPEAYPASSSSSNAHRWRLQFFWLTTTFHGAIGHAYLFLLITFLQLFVISTVPIWYKALSLVTLSPRPVNLNCRIWCTRPCTRAVWGLLLFGTFLCVCNLGLHFSFLRGPLKLLRQQIKAMFGMFFVNACMRHHVNATCLMQSNIKQPSNFMLTF